MSETEYQGLTHACDDPECHVPGFVKTLRIKGDERPKAHWTEDTPLTVGQIRDAIRGLPDGAQVFVDGHPDRPVVGALQSEQIPHEDAGTWEPGGRLVVGLELWLGGDDAFPAPRCNHADSRALVAPSSAGDSGDMSEAGVSVCRRCGLSKRAAMAGVLCDPPHAWAHDFPAVPAPAGDSGGERGE